MKIRQQSGLSLMETLLVLALLATSRPKHYKMLKQKSSHLLST